MKKINEEAAYHFAAGVFKSEDVPVDEHDLSRVRMTLTLPEGAKVIRAEGSLGKGYEAIAAPETVSLPVALLFIVRSGLTEDMSSQAMRSLWRSCIQEVKDRDLKPKDLMPPDAKAVLKELQAETPPALLPKKKTPAQRIGLAGVRIDIERLTIASHSHAGVSTKRMVRKA